MINSKIIVSTICYKVNNIDNSNKLIDYIDKQLTSEACKEQLDILFIDNTYDATINENKVNIVITSYITQTDIVSIVKKLRAFIDNNLDTIEHDELIAKMLNRRVY